MHPVPFSCAPNRRALPSHRSAVSLLVSLALASLAQAQTAAADADPPSDKRARADVQQLDVVVVTANRRREPARDVPIQVNTLSADQLERSGAASLADYAGSLPGIDVKTNGGPGRSQITLRGVTTGDLAIPTVGVYVDDVAFGSSSAFVAGATSALDMSLLDLDHIELLRGPQGTLYGAGAMGGLLKYVTHEPDTSTLSGKASVGVRSTAHGGMGHTEHAVVNVPLKEDVAGLRVAVFNDHDGGFVDAVGLAAGRAVNAGNTRGARVSLLVEPIAKLKLRLTTTAQDIKRDGTGYVEYNAQTGQPLDGDLVRNLAAREPYNVNVRLTSGEVEYDFGWARLNAIASEQRFDSVNRQDVTSFFGGAMTAAFGTPVDIVMLNNAIKLRKSTQELRLTSPRGTFEWLAGVYADKETGGVDQRLWVRIAADGSMADAVTTAQPSSYRETAAYGDLTLNLDKRWSLTAGARLARNKQQYLAISNGTPLFDQAGSSETSKTYLATVRYALDAVSNVYFRAASGYRPGGPNAPAIDATGQPIPDTPRTFRSDSLWSYELGYKADLLDKRLNVEAALYTIRWSDLQQNVALGASTIVTNAGKARVNGAELTLNYRPDGAWNFNASLAYTAPQLTQDTSSLGKAGARLPNTPRLAGSAGASYRFDLGGHAASAGLSLRRVGQRNAGFDEPGTSLPNFSMPGYTLLDAQAGVDFGRFQLALFGRNLTDKRALLAADTALMAFGAPLRNTVVQPRTVGATLTATF